jgi:two-component system sensor histidine kinase QseC
MGERFFRVIGSGESGSGLGWSIVRRIAAVHRAEVKIGRSTGLGGLAVEVSWQGRQIQGEPAGVGVQNAALKAEI